MDSVSRKWIAGGVIGIVALGGLYAAKYGPEHWHYLAGLYVFGLCIVGLFGLISTAWGPSPLAKFDPFPRNGAERWAHGGIVGAIGILGLFYAAASPSDGVLYKAGLALFLIAAGYAFVLLKDWFDRYYAPPHSR